MGTEMRGVDLELQGFDPDERELPEPAVPISEETRGRLVRVIASITQGATPEEITGYLEDGFPPTVNEQLRRPLEFDELAAFANLLVAVMQTPPRQG